MNIEDHAQFMIQKYQLAIAIAIIQTKPDNITYKTYIDNIKNKINERNMESNFDIMICDDDFIISNDFTQCDDTINGDDQMDDQPLIIGDELDNSHSSVNILENFESNNSEGPLDDEENVNSLLDAMTQISKTEDYGNNCTQSTNFDETQTSLNVSINKKNELADHIRTICETYEASNLKGDNIKTDVISSTNHTIYNSNLIINRRCNTYSDSNNLFDKKTKGKRNDIDFNKENKTIDSQQTILYTLDAFTNNTHISQSQEENVFISNNHLLNRSKSAFNDNFSNLKVKDDYIGTNLQQYVNKSINLNVKQDVENVCHTNIETHDKNMYSIQDIDNVKILDKDTVLCNSGQRKHKYLESDNYNNKRVKKDTDESFSQNHCSQSEFPELNQNTMDIFGIDFNKNTGYNVSVNVNEEPAEVNTEKHDKFGIGMLNTVNDPSINFDDNAFSDPEIPFTPPEIQHLVESDFHDEPTLNISLNVTDVHKESKFSTRINADMIFKESIKKKNNIQNYTRDNSINFDDSLNLSQNVRNITCYKSKETIVESKIKESVTDTNKEIEREMVLKDISNRNYDSQEVMDNLKENDRLKQIILNNLPDDETIDDVHLEKKKNESILIYNIQKDDLTQNDLSDEEIDTQLEIVPFKVLEELNKIKSYLNRNEIRFSQGNSLDSGFKSSQPRSSYKNASQYSDVRQNESAHCLLSFLTSNQLSDNTTVIAEEISRILGKLVDKLHEEEKYPNFLEELLEKVSALLNKVYEGNNEEFNALMKRDDSICRLLLLNRSPHIIKYTIEKIINILENTYTDLNEGVFELKNIDKTENLCHIFHILEVILKRIKKSNESSQMSIQNSQDDDRCIKKSSLTEIWRRKWNLTKSEVTEGSSKKTCVLTKCSETLNKIIVRAMDGYSLVSFSALECFNLLQD